MEEPRDRRQSCTELAKPIPRTRRRIESSYLARPPKPFAKAKAPQVSYKLEPQTTIDDPGTPESDKAAKRKRRASLHTMSRKFSVPLFGRIRSKSGEDELDTLDGPIFDCERNTVSMQDRNCEATLLKLFDENTENAEVFERVMKPLCDEVLEGFNALIFAYGQTGTGKTYTLLGKKRLGVKGMLPRAIEYFLTAASSSENTIKVELSAVEVYGTSPTKILVYDLLADKNRGFDWECKKGTSGFDIKYITKKLLTKDSQDALITQAFEASHYAPTAKNPDSTRGHVTWIIELRVVDGESASKTSHMLVLDLAGSEGATALTAEFIKQVSKDVAEIRRREAGVINHGLTQLARIFREIRSKGVPSSTVSNGLRRVIHGFINKNMCIRGIFTLSPYGQDGASTYNTIKFINDVEKIRLKPKLAKKKVNVKVVNQQLMLRQKFLEEQILELRKKLKDMKTRYQEQERRKRYKEEKDEVTDRLLALGQLRQQLSDPTSRRNSTSHGFKQIQLLIKMQSNFKEMTKSGDTSGSSRWKAIRRAVSVTDKQRENDSNSVAPNKASVEGEGAMSNAKERQRILAKLLDNYQSGQLPSTHVKPDRKKKTASLEKEAKTKIEQITVKNDELKEENLTLQKSNVKLAKILKMTSDELKKKTNAMEKMQEEMNQKEGLEDELEKFKDQLKKQKQRERTSIRSDIRDNRDHRERERSIESDIRDNRDHREKQTQNKNEAVFKKLDAVENSLLGHLEIQQQSLQMWTDSIRKELSDIIYNQQTDSRKFKAHTISSAPYAQMETGKQKKRVKQMLDELSDALAASLEKKDKRFQEIFERSKAAFRKVMRALVHCNEAKKSAVRSKQKFICESSKEIERLRTELLKLTGSPRRSTKF